MSDRRPSVVTRTFAAAALLGGLCLSACSSRETADKVPSPGQFYPPATGDTLIEGTIADPAILNPVLASDSASFAIIGLVFNSLLKYDKDLNFEGDLAESWQVAPDGKQITFKLKPGLAWQDGQPLTSADVLFTYQTFMDPKVKTAYRSNYESISGMTAPDARTVRVRYREPFAPGLETVGGMAILPKHLLQGRDVNTADAFNTAPVGSGPFVFEEWKRAESLRLRVHAGYFDGRAYLDKVIYRTIPDASVQFLELQHGTIDTMGLTPNQFNREGIRPDFLERFNKYRYPSNQYTYLGFNLTNPLFKDPRVRRAIAMAIDRQALVTSVLEGLGTVGTGPYTPSSWAFDPKVEPLPFDPQAAKKLLVESGFGYGPDGMLRKDGKPVVFTILTNQGNLNREQTATIVQAQLKAIGMDVRIRVITWSTLLAEFINKRKFDALVMGWSLSQDPDLYDIWHSSKTGEQEFNFVSYANPEVDRLLVQGRTTFDRQARTRIYNRIHALIAQDVPYVFLYVPDSLVAVHKRVQGIVPGKAGIGYNFIRWYVPQGFQKYEP